MARLGIEQSVDFRAVLLSASLFCSLEQRRRSSMRMTLIWEGRVGEGTGKSKVSVGRCWE